MFSGRMPTAGQSCRHRCAWLGVPLATEEMGLDIEAVNGPDRAAATSADWARVAADLAGVREFVQGATARRCVALDGKQRMSLATLLGQTFSATRGFVLEIEHNGKVFRTDDHARQDGAFFDGTLLEGQGVATGVACIAFPTPVSFEGSLTALGIGDLPRLTLQSVRPIDGIDTLNSAVAEAKAALVKFRSERSLTKIHLFIKAPSHFAMTLGHRLNGVCDLQLYDWINGTYVSTLLLRA